MNRLMTPEHLHAVLNHLPLLGVASACIPLLYGLIRKNSEVVFVALLMVALFGASSFFVMMFGNQAEERFEHSALSDLLDVSGKAWLKTHEEQAKLAAVTSYGLTGLAIVALILAKYRPGAKLYLGWAVLILCLLTIVMMARVADSGGQIRHPEFRSAT
jgi:peptidoglycan/LPS O-acetylase OafA/YrhL